VGHSHHTVPLKNNNNLQKAQQMVNDHEGEWHKSKKVYFVRLMVHKKKYGYNKDKRTFICGKICFSFILT
jgi:hypothetical protein